MNILVLNLARFGDLLQSQAAISSLARQGHRVGLVCLDAFAEAADMLSDLEYIAKVPSAAFLEPAQRSPTGTPGWLSALNGLSRWRDGLLAEFKPDQVCNLIPCLASQVLARYLGGDAACRGFFVDERGFGVRGNDWATLLQGSAKARGSSPFNIVDLFREIAAAGPAAGPAGGTEAGDIALRPPDPDVLGRINRLLRTELPAKAQSCRGFVALQLGASADQRRWPVASYAALGDLLWQEGNYCPVILGSQSEIPLARRYAEAARHPHISLCGKTTLAELGAVLAACDLLVSNDTGTMHFASGLGIPVLAVFLATAQPYDTGPYRGGSCSVEPDLDCHPCSFGAKCDRNHRCRFTVEPGLMASLALSRLQQGEWRIPAESPGARVWVSDIDSRGYMTLRSLSGHGDQGRAKWLAVLRHYLCGFLQRPEGQQAYTPQAMQEQVALPDDLRSELVPAVDRSLALLRLFSEQGKVLLHNPVPLMRERFLSTWSKVLHALQGPSSMTALAILWQQGTQASERDLPGVLALAEDFARMLDGIRRELSC